MTQDDDPDAGAPAEDTDDAVRWAREQLDHVDAVELLRARPWSTTWRVSTPRRTAFLKATGPRSRYEAPLMQLLAQTLPAFVPDILATDAANGWLLMGDAGPTQLVRTTERTGQEDGGWDVEAWQGLLTRFAELQRAVAPMAEALIDAGVPDERPHQLGRRLAELLQDSPHLGSLTAAERDAAASLASLRTSSSGPASSTADPPGSDPSTPDPPGSDPSTPDPSGSDPSWAASSWAADLATLARTPIPATVQHGDLHDNNVSPGDDGLPRFFDFGDASIAHPFSTMMVPLRIAAGRGAPPSDLVRLRMAYLANFTDLAPLADLERVLDAALRLAWVPRATSWDRALAGTLPGQHRWGDPVAGTVRELLAASAVRRPDQAMDSPPP